MKAYQLKIVINDSHPPIWRRLVVPAGISFSQLTVILNVTMGWCGYHLSSYEFRDYDLIIADNPEDFGFSGFDITDASNTCIDELLDEVAWFTYTYDFGDDWRHRVTVEKILDDYDKNYPQVIKFKGDTPWEDCGGIYGFYDMLDTLNNPDSPEYNNILEWTGGKTDAYNVDYVNGELSTLYISDKSHEPMPSVDVYDYYFKNEPLFKIEFNNISQNYEYFDYEYEQDNMEEFFVGLDADVNHVAEILERDKIPDDDADFIMGKFEEISARLAAALIINEALYKKMEEQIGVEATEKIAYDMYKKLNEAIDEEE